jgi:hypothetical protein
MTRPVVEDLSEPIWFQFSGHKDSKDDVEENVNLISGKSILNALKAALLKSGWSVSTERYDSTVFAEDWGWCVFLRHGEALIMLGMHVLYDDVSQDGEYQQYLTEEWIDGGLSVEHFHKRTLGDRLRGRNKVDPEVFKKVYRSVWDTLSGLDYIRGLSCEHPEDH